MRKPTLLNFQPEPRPVTSKSYHYKMKIGVAMTLRWWHVALTLSWRRSLSNRNQSVALLTGLYKIGTSVMKVKSNLEPCQNSKMEFFVKIVNDWLALTIFAKSSIINVWHGSKYISPLQRHYWLFWPVRLSLCYLCPMRCGSHKWCRRKYSVENVVNAGKRYFQYCF